MEPLFVDEFTTVYHGDCLDVMQSMEPDSIDAIVTDPPYGLSFMGKDWDHGVPGEHFWREALRVAKPGAHLVAFGGTKTHHRLMVAIEDAGWEIRDCLGWLYGSGFPKSLNVSKAIDKELGATPIDLGSSPNWRDSKRDREKNGSMEVRGENAGRLTAPATEEAAKWSGWGTALKPAWEPIILARKPLCGTVAANVQRWGTGAINIDGCRVGIDGARNNGRQAGTNGIYGHIGATERTDYGKGRWPANILHDGSDEAQDVLGAAARFFYCAKASKSERDAGLDGEEKNPFDRGGPSRNFERMGSKSTPRRNHHPTVKPLALMRWLVRLVTPPDGVVFDPFMGSGTTLVAARAEGHCSIGVDLESEYCDIAIARVCHSAKSE